MFNSIYFEAELRNRIKWADGKLVKTELDDQVIENS